MLSIAYRVVLLALYLVIVIVIVAAMMADDCYSFCSSIGHLLVRCRWIIYAALDCLNDRLRSMYHEAVGDVRELYLLALSQTGPVVE